MESLLKMLRYFLCYMSFLQDGKEWDAPVLAAKFCLLGARCLLQTENRQNGLIAFWLQSIAFWLQSVFFKQKMDRIDLREMANSLYSLALENNLGDKEMVAMELPFRNLRISLE